MTYSAVIFDLDGTLVDSAGDIAEAVNLTLDECALPRVSEATVRSWIGDGVRALVTTALAGHDPGMPPEQVMAMFMRHYRACLLRSPRLYEGVIEALTRLHASGMPLAICTNKPAAMLPPLLAHLNIAGFFSQVLGGDSLPQRKPAAEPLLHLARGFKLTPQQCLMVGDSATDLGAANNAAMPIALVRYGYPRELDVDAAGAVAVVDDLRQLPVFG